MTAVMKAQLEGVVVRDADGVVTVAARQAVGT
jgi:hypothetical protein